MSTLLLMFQTSSVRSLGPLRRDQWWDQDASSGKSPLARRFADARPKIARLPDFRRWTIILHANSSTWVTAFAETDRLRPSDKEERWMHPWVKLVGKAIYANMLPNDLLSSQISIERASNLFKRYVELVEIENHSYCNRTCWFCPNVFMDRRSVNHLMSDTLFDKIIHDLQTIDYSQTLVWSRYHEPMADDSIYARVSEARRRLPKAYLVITSNGDYLNKRSLARVEDSGLDRLLLDLYLPDHKEHDPAELESSLEKFRKRTELVVEERATREYVISGSPIKITMGAPIYTKENMSTRGGLMDLPKSKTYTRRAACFAPIHHVVIDYNSQGMLCCQARSDASQHADAVIMDLNKPENTLFHFYRALGPARAGLVSPGVKCGICITCDCSDDAPDRLARNQTMAAILKASGLSKGVEAAKIRGDKRRYE